MKTKASKYHLGLTRRQWVIILYYTIFLLAVMGALDYAHNQALERTTIGREDR